MQTLWTPNVPKTRERRRRRIVILSRAKNAKMIHALVKAVTGNPAQGEELPKEKKGFFQKIFS